MSGTCSTERVTPAAMDTMSVSAVSDAFTSCRTARTTLGFTAMNSTSHALATSRLEEVVAMPMSLSTARRTSLMSVAIMLPGLATPLLSSPRARVRARLSAHPPDNQRPSPSFSELQLGLRVDERRAKTARVSQRVSELT